MSRQRHRKERYAILINGERKFVVLAGSQMAAVVLAAVDNRFREVLQERQGGSLIMTAKRVKDL